jgi:polysaccharide biosynthesis/export protein
MTASRFPAKAWWLTCALGGLLATLGGCRALDQHAEKKIPHLGMYDETQPRELHMVSHPPYYVEPPDELEVSLRPTALDWMTTTVTVQPDGIIDLGFYGDVYVSGLTLNQVEKKVAQQVAALVSHRNITLHEPIQASVKLINGTQSKRYYVLGTVTNQGSFHATGNETVLDAILTAGLRSNSIPEKAYLARPDPDGTCQIYRIDWEAIRQGNTFTNYQVFPGDRIIVPGGRAPGLLSTMFGGG